MARIPLRFGLPLLILLFTLAAGVFSYQYHARNAVATTEERALTYLRRELSHVQRNVDYLLRSGAMHRVQEQIGALGENPHLDFVLLVDDQGTVLASLRRRHRGLGVDEVAADLPAPARDFVMRGVNPPETPVTTPMSVNAAGTRAGGVYPVTLPAEPGEAQATRQGRLLAGYDLNREKTLARRAVAWQTLTVGAVLAVLALIVGLLTHFLVTRRLDRILRSINRLAAGDLSSQINLGGRDELAQVANALDHAAATIACTQEHLAQSEARLNEAQRIAGLGSWETELGSDVFECSPEAIRLYGLDAERTTMTLSDYLDAIHPTDRERVRRLISHAADGALGVSSAEYRIQRPDGGIRWIQSRWRIEHDADGQPRRFAGTSLDITERKRSEQALDEARERALVTLHSIGDAVITTDAEGHVAYLNPVAEQLTGWATVDASGKPLEMVFRIINEDTGETAQSPVHTCLREGRTVGLSNRAVLFSRVGRRVAIEDSAAPIRNGEGRVLGVVLVFHDVTEKRRLAHELAWQATHDSLTGLHNRYEFERRISDAIDEAKTTGAAHALIYFDLDQFKVVNDTCGHRAGDELLRQLPVVLQRAVRETDLLARLGGDEFGLIVYDCDGPAAVSLAELLLESIRDFRFVWETRTFEVGASVGVVPITGDSQGISHMMTAADLACYTAKDYGRGRVHFYQPDDEDLVRRHGELHQVSTISRALEDDRFVLYAQRIVPCARGDYTMHELLVRLVDEDGQIVAPGAFIPAAERYDLMPALDRWIIRSFFTRYAAHLHAAAARGDALYSINLSGASLSDSGFRAFVVEQIESSGIPPESVCFEITETAAIANLAQTREFIRELKARGCRFALDDFGAGVSSFAYLKNLPVDYLKIDGGFVRDMLEDPIDAALVASINHIGHELGIATIAEFVENDEVFGALQVMGVDFVQGFGVARPEPLSEMEEVNRNTG